MNEKGEKELDTISTSQALQIAGRAGRFSSVFKEGEVTTMLRDDLTVLKEILGKPVDPISVRLHLSIIKVNNLCCLEKDFIICSFFISDGRITPHSGTDRDVCLPSSPCDSLKPHCRSKYFSYIIILLTSNHHHLKHSVSVLLLCTGYICESRTSGWTLLCLQH